MTRDILPEELTFDEQGHLTEAALTAIADGQFDCLLDLALGHLEDCEPCQESLEHCAALSAEAQLALELFEAPQSAPAPARPFPRLAVACGLAVALLGTLPLLADLSRAFRHLPTVLAVSLSSLLTVARRLSTVVGGLEHSQPLLSLVTAVALATLALLVARAAPRRIAWKGVSS